MKEWAKREVELACKRENPDRKPGEWDYGCACYESALKAFNCLLDDGHSGYSWQITKQILIRLMDHKPLTPLEDNDEWEYCWNKQDYTTYQNKRISSVFKDVYIDGTVKYTDTDRILTYFIDDPNSSWSNGYIRKMIDDMFPISFPYIPDDKPFKVFVKENDGYGTFEVIYCITPNDERVNINRYFKDTLDETIEITHDEYANAKPIPRT